jgi:Transposase DDE domain group 1
MTPVRGDEEKQTADGESDSRDDRPCSAQLELWDLCGGQPDASEQKEQEADLGQVSARLMRERCGEYAGQAQA